ncbi:MAG: hypothetical protein JXB85_04900 [Anaerolineales bacterium]|nr:hypothetical protein [Anaerolineales bacterium]
MRITRDFLIRIAKETVQKRNLSTPDLVAAYLTGSLLREDPFLAGATDIDLVLVHPGQPEVRREIEALTPEIHIDICHHSRAEFTRPRELRMNPWLGPEMYNPMWLYESQHFLEFVQAGVRDKFDEPFNVIARSRHNASHARQIWSDLQLSDANGPELMLTYLKAVNHAANAVAVLNGGPLAERRFLLEFPGRAESAGVPELIDQLFILLGAPQAEAPLLAALVSEWETAFVDAADRPKIETRIHPARLNYYKLAFEALLSSESPQAILWPLLHTWTLCAAVLPATRQAKWLAACVQLELAGEPFEERLAGLDTFLDTIEELLENMAAAHGL